MRTVHLLTLAALVGCVRAPDAARALDPARDLRVVPADAVDWQALNPARGDASPRAATLWGDRNGTAATGFLVRFVDGFSSPPHIHNVTYRGVVISGEVHNADAKVDPLWMPAGSYWTQPKGAAHITAAKGAVNIAYIEIDAGPYLVRPTAQAFETDERAVNVHASNLVWVATGTQRAPRIAYLWGAPAESGPSGVLIRVQPGGSAAVRSQGTLRATFIGGDAAIDGQSARLAPGSHVSASGGDLIFRCTGADACVIYARFDAGFTVGAGVDAE